ncbi:MAG: hypothetical protein HKL99_00325 [Burkholderiales bacterium]|nr:hypothetical protein [Burkholderiales bacterium]
MSGKPQDPTNKLVDVDWDDPRLQELLEKTQGLRLDNRGTFQPRRILLRRGWHDGAAAETATLAAEHADGRLTLITDFPLERGDPVMIDKNAAAVAHPQHILAEVADCRRGSRPEDDGHRVFVITLLSHKNQRWLR